MMKTASKVKWAAAALSFAMMGCAIFNWSIPPRGAGGLEEHREQFRVLISCFAGLTILHNLYSPIVVVTYPIKALILFIFFLRFGATPEIFIPLITSQIVELTGQRNRLCNFLTASGIVVFFLVHMRFIQGEGWIGAFVPPEMMGFYIQYLIFLLTLTAMFQRLGKHHAEGKREVHRLYASVNRLTNANLDFQRYVSSVRKESIENERNRISREIHDSIGYTLTNINMMMEAAVRLIKTDIGKLFTLLLRTRHQTETGLEEMRRAMRELRAIGTEIPSGAAGLFSLAENFQNATGVEVQVEFGNLSWFFPKSLETVMYRIVQEGMTNAFRHGKATKIRIYFHAADEFLNITIIDNGVGSTQIMEGIGIAGMKERLGEFHGDLSLHNGIDGFEIKARIPL